MSAQREPDVIERMAVVYDETYNPSFDEEWDPVEERNKAMLAAVRVLKDHVDQLSTNEETRAAVWGVLNFAIAKHEHWLDIERRAGGKGE